MPLENKFVPKKCVAKVKFSYTGGGGGSLSGGTAVEVQATITLLSTLVLQR